MKHHSVFSGFAAFVSMSVVSISLFTGCGVSDRAVSTSGATGQISGSIHGGQQPITGANVYLFNIAGYQGSPSNSLLTGTGNTDGSGFGYVTTDSSGNFTITGDFTCPSYNTGVDVYLLATGGNPGLAAGTSNSAITLMAALGACNSIGGSTFVNVNEVSTVAAVTALQQFMTDGFHVSSPPNLNGIQNAFATVTTLVDGPTGTALSVTPQGNGTAPQATVNTLANGLATCVNSPGPTSAPCSALFTAATPSGGMAPTDTVSAMLDIAQNPGSNVAAIFALPAPDAPFLPELTTLPNDFTLGVTYTGGGLVLPGALAVDYGGNIFTTNCATCVSAVGVDSLVGFSPNGAILTGALGFTSGIHKPTSIAFDLSDDLWSTNLATAAEPDQVNRTDESDNEQSGFPFSSSSLGTPLGIAIDGNYNAWVANNSLNSIAQVTGPGSLGPVVTSSGFTAPTGVNIDGFGNIYAAGTGSSNILKFNSSGSVLSTFTGAGISAPQSITVDGGDHIWTVDGGTAVSEIFGYDGTATSGSSGYTSGIVDATTVSIAGDGTAWIANCRAGCAGSGSTAADNIVHLSTTGTNLNVSDGYQNPGLSAPTVTVIDPAGNLWISNTTGASLTELVGVAAPVLPNLTFLSSFNLLPSANLLLNPGFELAGDGTYVPDWTLVQPDGNPDEAYTEGGGHTGSNRLTEYNGTVINANETQTIAVANGNYLVSCWVQGGGGQTTANLNVSGYNSGGSTLSQDVIAVTTANKYNWNLVSIPNVPVANSSLTVGLYNYTPGGGAYLSWDDCSVTKE